jgi:hypothetical protein
MMRYGVLEILGNMLRRLYGPPDEVEVEEEKSVRQHEAPVDSRAASGELREAAGYLKTVARMTTELSGGDQRGYTEVGGDQFHEAMRRFSDRVR